MEWSKYPPSSSPFCFETIYMQVYMMKITWFHNAYERSITDPVRLLLSLSINMISFSIIQQRFQLHIIIIIVIYIYSIYESACVYIDYESFFSTCQFLDCGFMYITCIIPIEFRNPCIAAIVGLFLWRH